LFAALLPNTSASEAVDIANKQRLAVAKSTLALTEDNTLPLTARFGLVDNRSSVEVLLNQIDKAMYIAKKASRN